MSGNGQSPLPKPIFSCHSGLQAREGRSKDDPARGGILVLL